MTSYANRLDQLEARLLGTREPINVVVWGDEDAGPKIKAARAARGLPDDDETCPVNVTRVQWMSTEGRPG
jgi:hypothetical protein